MAYDKEYYEKNKDRIKINQREYYKKNKAAAAIRYKAWKAANPERVIELQKKHNDLRKSSKPKVLKSSNERAREWREKNREHYRAYQKEYQARRREKLNQRNVNVVES